MGYQTKQMRSKEKAIFVIYFIVCNQEAFRNILKLNKLYNYEWAHYFCKELFY